MDAAEKYSLERSIRSGMARRLPPNFKTTGVVIRVLLGSISSSRPNQKPVGHSNLQVMGFGSSFSLHPVSHRRLESGDGFPVAGAKTKGRQKLDSGDRAVRQIRRGQHDVRDVCRQSFATDFRLPSCRGGISVGGE